MYKDITFCASVMCVDWLNLGKQLKELEKNNIDFIHVDVIDGYFAPDFTMGSSIIDLIKNNTTLKSDFHIMAEEPSRLFNSFKLLPSRATWTSSWISSTSSTASLFVSTNTSQPSSHWAPLHPLAVPGQATTRVLRVIASVRANASDEVSAAVCDRMRLFSTKFCRDGAAITATIATIANVTSSSIRVKP